MTGNYAFIDSQNVNLGIRELGWSLDFKRFRVYLKEKYDVERAYIFIGHIPENQKLYTRLQEFGYILIHKPTFRHKDGTVKGNCDAELVLQAMIDFSDYQQALIVSGDGDFYCLVEYLYSKAKLRSVLVPNSKKYSALLKRAAREKLIPMDNLRQKLEYKKSTA